MDWDDLASFATLLESSFDYQNGFIEAGIEIIEGEVDIPDPSNNNLDSLISS